jgi:hypothetical protein
MTHFFAAVSKDATIKASTSIHPSHKLNKIDKQHLPKFQFAIAKKTVLHSNTSADLCGSRKFLFTYVAFAIMFSLHFKGKNQT